MLCMPSIMLLILLLLFKLHKVNFSLFYGYIWLSSTLIKQKYAFRSAVLYLIEFAMSCVGYSTYVVVDI